MLPISGTLLNIATVLVGAVLGLLVGGRLPERFNAIILGGLGLSTLVVGMQNALLTQNILILIGSVLLGGIIGELLRIAHGLDQLGAWLQRRLARGGRGASTFSEAFVTSSLVFCVGPLTILGSIQNGVSGDMTLLAIKSLLDGFAAFAFAATLGWGVLMSTVTILVYQGGLSLIAWLLATGVPDRDNPYILEMTAVGGLIILGVGFKLLNLKDLKLANYLPALAVAPLIVWIIEVWPLK
jgi:uncharacterized membrane protein YqgA involved in biofilm formation